MVLTLGVWAGGLRSKPRRARKRGSSCTLTEPAWGYLYQLSSSTTEPSPLTTKHFPISLPPLPPIPPPPLTSLRSTVDISIGASRKTRRCGARWSSRTPRKGRASGNEGRGRTPRKSRGERGDRTSRPPGKCLGIRHPACTTSILTQPLHATSCSRAQGTKSHYLPGRLPYEGRSPRVSRLRRPESCTSLICVLGEVTEPCRGSVPRGL